MPQMQNVQGIEDVPCLNPNPDAYVTECLCCNDEEPHTERTRMKMCTVRLVDFRKTQGLGATIISEGDLHTGGNYD